MRRRGAFTLVELVVVVLILGILADVAAPKIVNNSDQATDSSIAQTLASIRDAVELYRATYNQLPPGTIGMCDLPVAIDEFLRGTNFPTCNVGGKNANTVKNVSGIPTAQAGTDGWVDSIDLGEIIINSSSPLISDPGRNYDDL